MKRAVTIALCCWALGSQAHAQAPAQPTVLPAADGGTVDLHDMSARVDTAVARLIEQARADARAALAKKNYAAALKSLESAHELDPTSVETTLQLADLQVLLGHAERAEALYRELIALAPDRGSAHAALADLLAKDASKPERLKEAGDLYARARELLGNDASLLLRQARLAATRGLSDEAERTYQSYLQSTRPDDALRLELGDFYRDEGKPDEAARWYREVSSGERARLAAQRIFELEVDREARRYGLSRPDTASDAQARALAAKARVQSAQGQKKPAEALLREALRSSPGLASVHADLADLLRETQRDDEAELEYLRALALDGTLPDVPLRLSQLYLAAQSPRAAEAALLAERALQLRPDWTEPQLLLARAYRAQGDLPRALSRVKRFLAQAPEGEEREQALALQTALEGLLGGAATASESATGGHGQKLPRDPLARARAFIARGRADAALVELQRLNARETNVEALALQAQLLRAAGRAREAATVLERALQAAPERADLHQAIAASLLDLGHEAAARPHLLDCERAHRAACTYWLARLDAGADHGLTSALHDSTRLFDLLRARDRLANLHADRDGQVSQGDIDALRTRTGQRITAVSVMALALLVLLGITALAVYRRRWGGLDLGTFLDRHPDAGPDVQRVLSAIRHEVLKHNTLMLGGLIESVRGGAATREAAEHILRAFFGDDGRGGV
ncbi:MAG TPA: tetratricopeptide repeat protein, partial [Polyangiales bacterium]|nr:tetratricopeptide repeat protein [Polyangiales bacterium]